MGRRAGIGAVSEARGWGLVWRMEEVMGSGADARSCAKVRTDLVFDGIRGESCAIVSLYRVSAI